LPLVLLPISLPDLEALAAGTFSPGQAVVQDEALPPQHVAVRALRLLAQGNPQEWCCTFLMSLQPEHVIVGSCGFKGPPVGGRVEVGYGVAPGARNQGHASAAVQALLGLAFGSGQVTEVLAEIAPANLASARVVAKLGFIAGGTRVDEDGDAIVQWLASFPAGSPILHRP